MSHTLFAAVTQLRGEVAALGVVDQSQAQQLAAVSTKLDELSAKVDAMTEAMQVAVNGMTQTLLNVQAVIGAPGDQN